MKCSTWINFPENKSCFFVKYPEHFSISDQLHPTYQSGQNVEHLGKKFKILKNVNRSNKAIDEIDGDFPDFD